MTRKWNKYIVILLIVAIIGSTVPSVPYIRGATSDFLYKNNSPAAKKTRVVNGYEITLLSMYYENGQFHFITNTKNVSEELKEAQLLELYFYDACGELLSHMGGILGDTEPEDTVQINASMTSMADITRIYDWSIKFEDGVSSEVPAVDSTVDVWEQYVYAENQQQSILTEQEKAGLKVSVKEFYWESGQATCQIQVDNETFAAEEGKEYELCLKFYDGQSVLLGNYKYSLDYETLLSSPVNIWIKVNEGAFWAENWSFQIEEKSEATPSPSPTATPSPTPTATPTGLPIYFVSLTDEKKTKIIEDYQIDVDYIRKEGISIYFSAFCYNLSEERKKDTLIDIELCDEEGKALITMGGIINRVERKETTKISAQLLSEQIDLLSVFKKVCDWNIKIIDILEDEELVPTPTPTPTPTASPTITPVVTPSQTPSFQFPMAEKTPAAQSNPSVSQVKKLKGSISSTGKVKITWGSVSGAEQYDIYRGTSKKGKYEKIKSISAKKSSYTDKNVKKGKTYYYKVLAKNKTALAKASEAEIICVKVPYLKKPVIKLQKGKSGKIKYIQIQLKKYEGKYAEIYVKRRKKYIRLNMKKKTIAQYKRVYRFRYNSGGNMTLTFKVRTYQNVKGKKRKSPFSNAKKITTG